MAFSNGASAVVVPMSSQPFPGPQEAASSSSPSASSTSAANTTTAATNTWKDNSSSSTSQSQSLPPTSSQPRSLQQSCYTSLLSTSPRQLSSDLPDAILEEGAESGSDSPVEPVTPTSADGGRHSQDFTNLTNSVDEALYFPSYDYSRPNPRPSTPQKAPLLTSQAPTPDQPQKQNGHNGAVWRPTPQPIDTQTYTPADDEEPVTTPLSRRSTRGSTSSFKRTMSNLFRRSGSNSAMSSQPQLNGMNAPPTPQKAPAKDQPTSRSNPPELDPAKRVTSPSTNGGPPSSKNNRRFSISRSATTTRSNTPPSPGSPIDERVNSMSISTPNGSAMPGANEFDAKKKNRSSTGLSLRGRTINFLTPAARGGRPARNRRANSFESERAESKTRPPKSSHSHVAQEQPTSFPPERLPWALPPEAGTGAKARRMSLSLPDDFTVDVAELSQEFEYQHKFLGRHGKHLGKGAASKVTAMARKGYPEELYAVKEFRGKSGRETKEDYEKKIKSEYSIAKSLHHPNIVETIRLCTDHGRWNHVMEYCSEGDLFSLVSKGHLKDEGRKKDRLCLFKQLVQGVHYLHEHGIAHRDIKLENLLITKDSKLKITDFGVSEVFSGTHPGLRESGGVCGRNMSDEVRLCSPGICGSEPYIAPEVLAKKGDYDPRPLDVWSTAIVMVYLTFGGAIWTRAEPGNQHYDALVRGWDRWYAKHPEPDASITDMDYPHHKAFDIIVSPPALRRVLLQMLNPDPSKRISIAEVANNRWMKNVECCQVESYDDPTQVIDASKPDPTWNGHKRIFCHNHLPPKSQGHSLGKMPGQPGY